MVAFLLGGSTKWRQNTLSKEEVGEVKGCHDLGLVYEQMYDFKILQVGRQKQMQVPVLTYWDKFT